MQRRLHKKKPASTILQFKAQSRQGGKVSEDKGTYGKVNQFVFQVSKVWTYCKAFWGQVLIAK